MVYDAVGVESSSVGNSKVGYCCCGRDRPFVTRVFVGMSGGVDSSLAAALLVLAMVALLRFLWTPRTLR